MWRPARRLLWLLGCAAQWCGVVGPDQLVMDATTAVALAAGECRAYQIAVTAVMAASNRGLLVEVSLALLRTPLAPLASR